MCDISGDSVNFKTAQFEELLAMPLGPNGIDLSVLVPFRVARVHNSISTNGHFFAGPLTHNVINAATYFFTYRYFANHTAEQPEGYLDEETLKSFEGVTGSKGSFQWASGRERIPDNVSNYTTMISTLADVHLSGIAAPSEMTTVLHPSFSTPPRQFWNIPTWSELVVTRASRTLSCASTSTT